MKYSEVEMIIESILFAAGEPVEINKIANVIGLDKKTTKNIIKSLSEKYIEDKRGVVVIEVDDSFQMCTNPVYFEYIKSIFKTSKNKTLTQTLVETLAIIAYKQPITKSQIEEIRGVNADHSVNKLMEYNLICEKGRLDSPGRPILFGTTDEFLKYYGYNNLNQLPSLDNIMSD